MSLSSSSGDQRPFLSLGLGSVDELMSVWNCWSTWLLLSALTNDCRGLNLFKPEKKHTVDVSSQEGGHCPSFSPLRQSISHYYTGNQLFALNTDHCSIISKMQNHFPSKGYLLLEGECPKRLSLPWFHSVVNGTSVDVVCSPCVVHLSPLQALPPSFPSCPRFFTLKSINPPSSH